MPEGLIPYTEVPFTMERWVCNLVVILGSTLIFTGIYLITKAHFERTVELFPRLDWPQQGIYISIFISTFHALLVPVGLLCSISACNLWGHPFANTCAPAEIFFSVSIGYFIYDLCQVVSYKYSMWQVFVAHHTVAAIPYIINNLGYRSAHTHLCLSLFLCVELVNPFTNATYYLELKKYPPGAWQAQVNMHLKWIFWTIFRVALPLYLFYHVFWVVFPVYRFSKWYINVSYIGAIAICFFCVSAYSLVIMPPIVTQVGNDCLERTSSKTDLAPATNGADTATDLETGNGEEMKADPPAPAVSCDDAPLNRSGDYQVATEIKHEEKH
jgi:hypothetical protein